MLRVLAVILCWLFLCVAPHHEHDMALSKAVPSAQDDLIVLEDFESDEVHHLPRQWFNRDGRHRPFTYPDEDRRKYSYEVLEEQGNRFLRYAGWQAKHLNLPIGTVRKVNLSKTPIVTWRWRAWVLPEGANEAHESKNDAVLSVYVVFDVKGIFRIPTTIRYTWSSSLPEGTVISGSGNNQKIIVLASGRARLGAWQTVQRNLLDDYRDNFGGEPSAHPVALLILSDADNTKTWAKGDYDDFRLLAQ